MTQSTLHQLKLPRDDIWTVTYLQQQKEAEKEIQKVGQEERKEKKKRKKKGE